MFGELCRLCERPAADGGHRAAELDKDKLAEWCLNFLGTTLAKEIDDRDLFCYFCVWDARFYHNKSHNEANGEDDYDMCWWPEQDVDKNAQDLHKNYTDGKLQQCWVSLEKLPSEEKASADAGGKTESRDRIHVGGANRSAAGCSDGGRGTERGHATPTPFRGRETTVV
ncbi:uncharacterized protein LOC132198317 isoform X3 [Neocloeon triangulifer]|uniref:uncharacterized protein LOC132198317 isoform X3 n=1 Tax=Neocloeon triangulifer TaxID=2078957 RepID=UPI00286F6720|nr:uncharacterized protein LOC132198317 isoform X3 [Neocloeon triangulifer]